MKFTEIEKNMKVSPGEYILHVPSKQIVLCVSFSWTNGNIKVLSQGKMFVDKIENFKKINVTAKDRKEKTKKKGCGCKKAL